MKRTALKPGKGFARKSPIATAGLLRVAAVQRERKSKPMKSRGMKGRAPTAAERAFMDAVATLGCIACRREGWDSPVISIHHIDGRTKPGAHFLVLPLCAPHHQQDDSDPLGRVSVHGWKTRFETRYGTQRELLAECIELIKDGTGSTAIDPAPEHLSLEQ